MGNVLSHTKQQQVVALGRLGWSLRRIAVETQVHRDTAGAYLRVAGVPVRGRGGRPTVWPPKPSTTVAVSTDPAAAKPATTPEVSSDLTPTRAPSASACEIYREVITEALSRGRNAMAIWQDLVDDHGCTVQYASVRRFVHRLRGTGAPEARVVITTAAGEDYGERRVMLSRRENRR